VRRLVDRAALSGGVGAGVSSAPERVEPCSSSPSSQFCLARTFGETFGETHGDAVVVGRRSPISTA
jgi:hypothetical protein